MKLPGIFTYFRPIGYRHSFCAYFFSFVLLFSPYLLQGKSFVRYLPTVELGISGPHGEEIGNRKFSDYLNQYVGEIKQHLEGERSSWLATWTNLNELGRPLRHDNGFSPAYFPAWVLQKVIHDPFRFITILSLGTCFIAGIFGLLLMREMQFTPLTGFVVAWSMATSPLFLYWLTVPNKTAVWCWAAGILFCVVRLTKGRDLAVWVVLSFSTYSVLMTGYPQLVLLNAYVIGGYFFYRVYLLWKGSGVGSALKFCVCCLSAVLLGAACALPVYVDMFHTALESARFTAAPSFFTGILPDFNIRFLALSTFPEVFGKLVSPSYPWPYNGVSMSPMLLIPVVVAFLSGFRRYWGWGLAVLGCLVLTLVHPVHLLAVKCLGFNLSRCLPLAASVLPLSIMAAYGTDAIIKQNHPRLRLCAAKAAAFATAMLLLALGYAFWEGVQPQWDMFVLSATVIYLLVVWTRTGKAAFVVIVLAIVAVGFSRQMMFKLNSDQVMLTSPLVDAIRENLPTGSRYAVAGDNIAELPPNFNAVIGLASIHSYNSLSSRIYQSFIKNLGGETIIYGRVNYAVSPDFGGAAFWMSDIGLLLSSRPLEGNGIYFVGHVGSVHLYRVKPSMGAYLRVPIPENEPAGDLHIEDPRHLPSLEVRKTVDHGDLLEFEVSGDSASALILSQKYHRDWRAFAQVGAIWKEVPSVPVNDFFQGVRLPGDATRVRLHFEPFARYSWLGHVFFSVLGVLILISTLWKWIQRPHHS